MTSCDEIRARLSAYVDAELSEIERERVRRHLAACAGCRREWRALAETAQLLGGLPPLDPPESLERGLRRQLRRKAAATIVFAVLLLLAAIPIVAFSSIVARPDLPVWARVGFGVSLGCFASALLLLVAYLLRHARQLVFYGYLSGGRT